MNKAHVLALEMAAAYALDAVLGDPESYPHPVRLMGKATENLEKVLRPRAHGPGAELAAGAALALVVISASYALTSAVRRLPGGSATETLLLYTALAREDLARSALRVARSLEEGDLDGARDNARALVGRDTAALDGPGLVRAAIESVGENLVDGVLSPLFWGAIGGPPAALAFKAASTLDSMLGHRNDKYLYLGKAAARIDDLANFITARLSVALIAAAAALTSRDARAALRVGWSDRKKHASINSAHPEAAFAGALGLSLGGSDTYAGKLRAVPLIGRGRKPLKPEQIRQAVSLMNATSLLGLALGLGIIGLRRKR